MKKRKMLLLAGLLIVLSGMGYWFRTGWQIAYTLEKVKDDPDRTIQIFLPRGDYRLDKVELGSNEEPNSRIQNFKVTKKKVPVGTLSFEGAKLEETGDYYYFLRYNPTINEDTPLQIHVRVQSSSQEAVERHILYPFDQAKQQPILTIPNSTWTEANKIASGYGLPRQAMFIDGEDFSMHLNMVNVYEALGNGVRKEHFDLTLP
ncbi:MAG: hypothetical protein AB2421_19490, partial [Thermotaleaceae bacterium]